MLTVVSSISKAAAREMGASPAATAIRRNEIGMN
jgi:hypothetical protein